MANPQRGTDTPLVVRPHGLPVPHRACAAAPPPDDAMFVHIPKTGGTAMEEKYKTLGRASAHSMIKDFKKRWELEHGARLRSQCVGAGQEFHFTPEEVTLS